jgi:hypothetical protein
MCELRQPFEGHAAAAWAQGLPIVVEVVDDPAFTWTDFDQRVPVIEAVEGLASCRGHHTSPNALLLEETLGEATDGSAGDQQPIPGPIARFQLTKRDRVVPPAVGRLRRERAKNAIGAFTGAVAGLRVVAS